MYYRKNNKEGMWNYICVRRDLWKDTSVGLNKERPFLIMGMLLMLVQFLLDMMMDVAGLDFDAFTDEEPHRESQEFYELLRKADEPLWPS